MKKIQDGEGITENGSQKWIQRYQIRGGGPLFIDTWSKSWPSD